MILSSNESVIEAGLQPQFRADIHDLLIQGPYYWGYVYGYRDNLTQQILYNKYLQGGPLAAPPGKSAHNFGLAVDVVLMLQKKNGEWYEQWNYLHPGWSWLWAKVLLHPRLHSGKIFGDPDHIQDLRWRLDRYAA